MSDNKIRAEQTEGLLDTVATDATLSGDGTVGSPLHVVGGGGGGAVDTIVAGTGITVDATDPENPIVATTITQYTDEMAQDAIGSILVDSSTIDFTYSDATPSITASIIAGSVTNAMLAGSIASSKLVGTDITTVGTIATGTWNATTISVAKGGTGATTLTTNALLLGNGTSAVSSLSLGTANQVLGINTGATANEYKTISVGTTGIDVNIAFASNSIVINIPDASGTNRGVVTTSAQTLRGVKTFENYPVGPGTTPTLAAELIDKAYADALFQGINVHRPVAVASTGNLTLSGEQTIDGVLTSSTRILVKDQGTTSQNGVYVTASGSWVRSGDFDAASEIVPGATFYVNGGTTQTGTLWVQNETVTTVGTDPITFGQVNSPLSYTFFVSQTNDGSDDFSVTQAGTVITSNLPTAGHGVRGALDGGDFDRFDAKLGTTGSFTTGQVPKISGSSTLTESGWTISISGGATSTFAIPTSGTGAVIGGTLAQFAATTSAQLAGVISDETGSGALVFGTSPTLTTPNLGTPSALTLTNATGLSLTTGVTGVLPVANGGFNATDVQTFTSSGTWTKPTTGTPKTVEVILIGGGGGGGSGRKGASGTVRSGGGGGGAGGYARAVFSASILSSTETITVGTGGAGGASQTTNSTNGTAGTAGIATTFGTTTIWLRAGNGFGGGAGSTGAASGGTGGLFFPPAATGSGGIASSATGGNGAGGAAVNFGPGGGASGSGITTGNVANIGGVGIGVGASGSATNSGYGTVISGGTFGAINTAGGNGNNSPTNSGIGGSGGGGGGSSTTTNAGAGGNGGLYGGGGGGGGAAVDSTGNSGAGGTGGNGFAIIITYF